MSITRFTASNEWSKKKWKKQREKSLNASFYSTRLLTRILWSQWAYNVCLIRTGTSKCRKCIINSDSKINISRWYENIANWARDEYSMNSDEDDLNNLMSKSIWVFSFSHFIFETVDRFCFYHFFKLFTFLVSIRFNWNCPFTQPVQLYKIESKEIVVYVRTTFCAWYIENSVNHMVEGDCNCIVNLRKMFDAWLWWV